MYLESGILLVKQTSPVSIQVNLCCIIATANVYNLQEKWLALETSVVKTGQFSVLSVQN